jgi:hypothetical protein
MIQPATGSTRDIPGGAITKTIPASVKTPSQKVALAKTTSCVIWAALRPHLEYNRKRTDPPVSSGNPKPWLKA